MPQALLSSVMAEHEPEDINLAGRCWQREGHHTNPWTQHLTSLNHILPTLQPPASAYALQCVKQFEAEDA